MAPALLAKQALQIGLAIGQAWQQLQNGDEAGAAKTLASAGFGALGIGKGISDVKQMLRALKEGGPQGLYDLLKACFGAGTPLLTPTGWKNVEDFRPGDQILTRSEHERNGQIVVGVVEEVFYRLGGILELTLNSQLIRTTAEHPFWLEGKGWTSAGELKIDDQLISHQNEIVIVEKIQLTDQIETVYNLCVSEYHTYFVGCQEWELSRQSCKESYSVAFANGCGGIRYITRISSESTFTSFTNARRMLRWVSQSA
jgi:hypothetical protein